MACTCVVGRCAAEEQMGEGARPEAKRWAFVTEAILAAQPFLSGLSAKQQATARDLAARKFAPIDHAQLVATEAVISRVKDESQVLLGRYGKVLELRNTPNAKADDGLPSCSRRVDGMKNNLS